MRKHLIAIAILSAACGGDSKPAATDTTPKPVTAGDDQALCEQMFTRQRECTDVYIPALVSWRVEADVPAGIAARDQAEGREALVAAAMAEWAEDSKPERVTAHCAEILASMPEEHKAPMREPMKACLQSADCPAYVSCVEVLHRERFQQQKAAATGAEE